MTTEQQEEFWGMPVSTYCMLLHLSQLSSFVAPGLGFVLPVVMWAVNKDKNAEIDRHGKATLNWMISLIIYLFISFLLWIFIIGIFGFIILLFLNLVFAVVAAAKANDGKLWIYPMSIQFFKIHTS